MVTAAAAASVAERERERQLVVELNSAEEERQLHNQLRGCSLVCYRPCVELGASERQSLVRGGWELLGRTASSLLAPPETWKLSGATRPETPQQLCS